MDEFLAKNWHFVLGALGLAAAYGEARWKLQTVWAWMQHKTDPEQVQRRAQTEERLASAVEHLASAVTKMDTRIELLTDKYEKNTQRVWESIDLTNQRLARMEGKAGS